MDKAKYLEGISQELRQVADRLENRAFPPPSTTEAARQQDELRRSVEHAKRRVRELRSRVDTLKTTSAPLTATEQADLDRQVKEVTAAFAVPR